MHEEDKELMFKDALENDEVSIGDSNADSSDLFGKSPSESSQASLLQDDGVLADGEGDVPGLAVAAPKGPALDDRSHLQPPNCSLRKYRNKSGRNHWRAILPKGVASVGPGKSKHSKQRQWANHLVCKTEEDAIAELEQWLEDHHKNAPVTATSDSSSSSSSSSQSSSG